MADNTANKLQVSFRVTPAVRRALDLKLAADDRQQTELMNALIADYLGGALDPPASPAANPRNEKWHAMLDEILESGDREAISAVQQNILVFHRIVGAEETSSGKRVKKKA